MAAIEDKFRLKPKEDKFVTMTIRLKRELQEAFDRLAATSDRSRNEVMCMALRYALARLELAPKTDETEEIQTKKG